MNELREKAQSLVYAYDQMVEIFPVLANGGDDAIADSVKVCRAYLAEHPADDAEILVEDMAWLIRVGFTHENENRKGGDNRPYFLSPKSSKVGSLVQVCYEPLSGCDGWSISPCPNPQGKRLIAVQIPEMQTFGDVRRLCASLGIELKGA